MVQIHMVIKIISSLIEIIRKSFEGISLQEIFSIFMKTFFMIIKDLVDYTLKFIFSINDIFMSFWNFGSEHHIIAILITLILPFIYYFFLNLIFNFKN